MLIDWMHQHPWTVGIIVFLVLQVPVGAFVGRMIHFGMSDDDLEEQPWHARDTAQEKYR